MVIIKLSLKILIALVVFIGVFISLKPLYLKDNSNSYYAYSSYEDSSLIKDNTQNITSNKSESDDNLISSENRNKKKDENNTPLSSKEFRRLLQNTKKCIKSKFQIIK